MPYSQTHYLMTVKGSYIVLGSPEQWQFGLRIAERAAFLPDRQQVITNDLRDDVATWWTSYRNYYAASTRCESVKLARIGVDGKYPLDHNATIADLPAGVKPGGSTAGQQLPTQLAIAVTLTTAKPRGLAYVGRVFLPAPSSELVEGGRIGASAVQQTANLFAGLINNINNNAGLDQASSLGNVVIASKTRLGAEQLVTGVAVGGRWDVQRRRAESIPEIRVQSAVAITPP